MQEAIVYKVTEYPYCNLEKMVNMHKKELTDEEIFAIVNVLGGQKWTALFVLGKPLYHDDKKWYTGVS